MSEKWFDDFKSRLGFSGGSISGEIRSATEHFVDESFSDSPFFKIIEFYYNDSEEKESKDTILRFTNDANVIELLFRPNEFIYEGSIIKIDNEVYLATELFFNMGMFPKVEVHKCMNEINFEVKSYPCFMESAVTARSTHDTSRYINLPDDGLLITTQYNNDTNNINIGDDFTFRNRNWEVQSIDNLTKTRDVENNKNEIKGLIVFNVKEVELKAEDEDARESWWIE